jgi:hypothetical protein
MIECANRSKMELITVTSMGGVFNWFPSGKHAACRPSDYLTKGFEFFDLDFESNPCQTVTVVKRYVVLETFPAGI